VFAEILRRRAGVLGLFFASIGAAGCTIEAGPSAPPPVVVVEPGRLTLRWTVSETVDPNLCVLGRAAAIEIAISTAAGVSAGEFQAPCAAFATTVSSLYPGNYWADAWLIDAVGRARTTVIEIRPFTILDRSELILDVDFPADSFLDGLERNATGRAGNGAVSGTAASASPADPSASPGNFAGLTSP